jgi:hypothetical protein
MTDWSEASGPYTGGATGGGTASIDVDLTEGNILFLTFIGGSWGEEEASVDCDLCSGGMNLLAQRWGVGLDNYMVGVAWGLVTETGSGTISANVSGGRVGVVASEWTPPAGEIISDSNSVIAGGETTNYAPVAPANTSSSMFVGGAVSGDGFSDTSGGGTYYYNGFEGGIGGMQLCLIPDAVGSQSPPFTLPPEGGADVAEGFAGLALPPDNLSLSFVFEISAIGQ